MRPSRLGSGVLGSNRAVVEKDKTVAIKDRRIGTVCASGAHGTLRGPPTSGSVLSLSVRSPVRAIASPDNGVMETAAPGPAVLQTLELRAHAVLGRKNLDHVQRRLGQHPLARRAGRITHTCGMRQRLGLRGAGARASGEQLLSLPTTDKLCANVLLKKVPELAPILGQPKLTPNCELICKFDFR